MHTRTRIAATWTLIATLAIAVVVGASLGGCVTQPDETSTPAPPGVNSDPQQGPGDVIMPADPDLTTPEAAVRSYLDWISLSYRLANSQVSTPAMTAYEGVRVDSYIELNRQDNVAIDQMLEAIELETASVEETVAIVVSREDWSWRYFTLDTITWTGELESASYDATYTVLLEPDGAWRVDHVEASRLDAAQGSADE